MRLWIHLWCGHGSQLSGKYFFILLSAYRTASICLDRLSNPRVPGVSLNSFLQTEHFALIFSPSN